ncbi:MAG: hypothetical protein J7J01_02680 [Methanophagales archaeon]|nr:hypothetical protein [Methanophagales archaeon]
MGADVGTDVGSVSGGSTNKKPDFNYHVEIVGNKVRITVRIELGIEDIMNFVFKAMQKPKV